MAIIRLSHRRQSVASISLRLIPSVILGLLFLGIGEVSAQVVPVTGTEGCLLRIGEEGDVKDHCVTETAGSENSWVLANFVTADQVNPAITTLQQQIDNLAGAPTATD